MKKPNYEKARARRLMEGRKLLYERRKLEKQRYVQEEKERKRREKEKSFLVKGRFSKTKGGAGGKINQQRAIKDLWKL